MNTSIHISPGNKSLWFNLTKLQKENARVFSISLKVGWKYCLLFVQMYLYCVPSCFCYKYSTHPWDSLACHVHHYISL